MKVNKKQLAEILGVTQKTITNYQSQGLPFEDNERGVANVYDTKEVIRWFVERELNRRYGASGDVRERLDKDYEQARLAKAQADGKEIENKIKQGELAPVELLTQVLSHVSAQTASILESIPQKVKRQLPELPASGVEVIKREIIKCQNTAARADANLGQYIEDYCSSKGGVKAP
jgi:phage terminase Nu1 subunit (DNA packaging protein)